jgi:hypothetical protein
MKTRQENNHNNLIGPDVDIEISLKEYGLAWIISSDEETLFYYGIRHNGTEYVMFDFCALNPKMDIKQEYDWIKKEDWADIYDYTGQNEEEWNTLPFVEKISYLHNYYGSENIFGATYWEGLTYDEIFK